MVYTSNTFSLLLTFKQQKIQILIKENQNVGNISKSVCSPTRRAQQPGLISPAKSFAPFPTGCMFHSETWLKSFEHPKNKMKAMPRIDSEGVICGANFKVDACSKISVIPRRGSEANWALANTR